MKTVRLNDGWWITGIPDTEDAGPYGTRAEADEDRKRMQAFLDADKRGDVEFIHGEEAKEA